jgi:hypothetical protein
MLDIMKIPYTHSGLLASALCINKNITHQICQSNNIKTAQHELLHQGQDTLNQQKLANFASGFVFSAHWVKTFLYWNAIVAEVIGFQSKLEIIVSK